ncbi:MAG: methylenetetrahydrofolate reductase C-terminal domain-containing protein, partial [Candidatus Glassbacteria bacterium]|nr:methylenetetrahydrofolate reductase C-terminal domain-containing protein [Candidatus Glassbacteria bacterium]
MEPGNQSLENRFRSKLTETEDFVITVELVPSRGLMRKDFGELIAFAEQAVEYGKIDALSFTDNPGGNPRLSPDVLGLDILYRGMSPLIHLSCKDYNRNGIESRAFQLNRIGIQNVLALTGDFPVDGFHGMAKPSFDLDSVGMICMLDEMNQGLKIPARKPGAFLQLEPTDFFIGACVSPFKRLRSESFAQYFKLGKKIANNARFIITQVGYDARKFDELLRYLRLNRMEVPVLGDVYVLHRVVSRLMNANQVPGCVVTDPLLEWVNRQAKSDDKGKAAFVEFAARQVAVLRGIGYRGAHIGGFGIGFEDVRKIIDTSEEIAGDWRSFVKELAYPQEREFYHFSFDPATGLNTDEHNLSNDWEPEKEAMLPYRLMKLVHDSFFEEDTAGFNLARALCRRLDSSPRAAGLLYRLEKTVKWVMNDCQECGDCSLPELAFLCPESQCAKFQRNGPCGGSRNGICELEDRPCVW